MDNAQQSNARIIFRGTLQVTLAMMAAASCTGWLLLGFLATNSAGENTLVVALSALTLLYGLLGFALGAVLGRRQRSRGMVSAILGTMLTWGILEFFFHLAEISCPELRAPLVFGIPMCVIGAVVGMTRPEDRAALKRELRQEIEELDDELESLEADDDDE